MPWTGSEWLFFALLALHRLWSLFFIFSPFMENIIRQKKDGRHHACVSAVCRRSASFSGKKKNAVLLAKPNMSWSETIQCSSGGVNSSVPHNMFPQTVSHYHWGPNQRGPLWITTVLWNMQIFKQNMLLLYINTKLPDMES